MVGSESLLSNLQGTLMERFGLGVAPLREVQRGQSIEAGSGLGMVGTEGLLNNLQGELIERIGLRVAAPIFLYL